MRSRRYSSVVLRDSRGIGTSCIAAIPESATCACLPPPITEGIYWCFRPSLDKRASREACQTNNGIVIRYSGVSGIRHDMQVTGYHTCACCEEHIVQEASSSHTPCLQPWRPTPRRPPRRTGPWTPCTHSTHTTPPPPRRARFPERAAAIAVSRVVGWWEQHTQFMLLLTPGGRRKRRRGGHNTSCSWPTAIISLAQVGGSHVRRCHPRRASWNLPI